MTGRGGPNWQPISMLATIAGLAHEGFKDAREQDAMLLRARRELRQMHTQIVQLADELGRATIERQLAKSEMELGLEYLLGLQRS